MSLPASLRVSGSACCRLSGSGAGVARRFVGFYSLLEFACVAMAAVALATLAGLYVWSKL